MPKPEWGRKRICISCSTKYYDFNKSHIVCPSCGTVFDPDIYMKSIKGKGFSSKINSENNKNEAADISNIDDIDSDTNEEVVIDEDPMLALNKEDEEDSEVDIKIEDDVSFIDDDEINEEDDDGSIETLDEQKND